MAYNKGNYYRRIIEIQDIVREKQKLGIPNTRIYRDYIEKQYFIAEVTFKRYLSVPAKRELKKMEAKAEEAKQMELFGGTENDNKDEKIQ